MQTIKIIYIFKLSAVPHKINLQYNNNTIAEGITDIACNFPFIAY